MRKNLQSKVLLTLLAASLFYLPAYANAASLEIDNDKITASDSNDNWETGSTIYHKSSLQNNTITISNKEYNNSQQIFGAYAAQIGRNDGSHTNLQNNNVSIENNTFSNRTSIVGAFARFGIYGEEDLNFNSTASLQNNSVTISGSTFKGITTIYGASADLTNLYLNSEQDKPTVEFTGNKVTIDSGTFNAATNVYGAYTALRQPVYKMDATYYNMSAALTGNSVTINNNAAFKGTTTISGAYAYLNNTSNYSSANCRASLTNNSVNINGGTFGDSIADNNPAINIHGAYINLHNVRDGVYNYGKIASKVTGNSVTISGGTFNAATNVYGAYADLTYQPDENHPIGLYYNGTAAITDNTVTLKSTASDSLTKLNLYGYGYNETAKDVKPNGQITNHSNNNLIVDGWSGTVGSVNNFDAIDFENIKVAKPGEAEAKSEFYIEASGDKNKGLADTTVNINSVDTSNYNKGDTVSGTLTLDSDIDTGKIKTNISNFSYQDNGDNGLIAETLSGLTVSTDSQTNNHIITISATVGDTVLAGKLMDANGTEHTNSNEIDTLTVGGEGFSTNNADIITGVYAAGDKTATGGEVNVAGSYTGKVYAGYSKSGAATGNTMTLTSGADVTGADLYGGGSGNASAEVTTGNTLTIDGWSGTVNSLNNFSSIVYEHVSGDMELNATTVTGNNMSVVINSIPEISTLGGNLKTGSTINLAAITLNEEVNNAVDSVSLAQGLETGNTWIYSDYAPTSAAETIGGIYANNVQTTAKKENNTITVGADVKNTVLAGKFIDAGGTTHTNSSGVTDLTISEVFSTNANVIAGAYALGDNDATGGKVYIAGNYQGTVYAGYSENGAATGNTMTLTSSADVSSADLYGGYSGKTDAEVVQDNTLTVNDWTGSVNSLQNFKTIEFENIAWKPDATVLTVAENGAALSGTAINLNSIYLAGGQTFNTGEKMTLITGTETNKLAITKDNVTAPEDLSYLAGVAVKGTGEATVDENGTVTYTIKTIELAPQTDMLAETHAATAAFVNQGTDLINDSLDVLGRDGSYGVKTFAAVQGNRSTYDVADDLKINGWSVIAGFGAENEHKGGDFAWGVFYENGSGNYRTYNTFNNEFFRGDGSMVYNGGGIAARYENAKGVYTEGSLRAGMLKNEMDNALRDVNGSYGYETESTYYGAHIGVGQIFEIDENTDLDVYGKFFHTYVDGDTVTIDNDVFDFDSITSDRLRVGARVTKQQAKVNTYYGLAYEYEFNGDADMKAAGIKADTQSFGGGTGIAELGFNYQPGTDSPWNFDLNLRGYVGERQGGSFNVQATYTF